MIDVKNTVMTLDGIFWNESEILSKMMDDDFYYNYLGVNALSSSSCKKLLDSPVDYRNSLLETNNTGDKIQPFRDGGLFHMRILEPEKWESLNFIDVASKNTKKYRLAVEELGTVYTYKEREQAEKMALAFNSNEKAADFLRNSRREVPAIGEIEGIPFRAKADILGPNYICDLKSTGDIFKFKYSADRYCYDLQAYIYCELFKISYKDFTFVAVDKSTQLVGLFPCSREFYERGKYKALEAIQIYRDFFIDKKKPVDDFYLYDVL